jgi:hypothetical protein
MRRCLRWRRNTCAKVSETLSRSSRSSGDLDTVYTIDINLSESAILCCRRFRILVFLKMQAECAWAVEEEGMDDEPICRPRGMPSICSNGEATRGNPVDEQRLIENSPTELRFRRRRARPSQSKEHPRNTKGSGTAGRSTIGCTCEVCQPSLDSVCDLIFAHEAAMLWSTPRRFSPTGAARRISCPDAILYTHAHADHILGLDDVRPSISAANRFRYGTEDTLSALRVFCYAS